MVADKVLAWLAQKDDRIEAAFVAAGTKREPARRVFKDPDAARKWVEHEAAELGAAISWVT